MKRGRKLSQTQRFKWLGSRGSLKGGSGFRKRHRRLTGGKLNMRRRGV